MKADILIDVEDVIDGLTIEDKVKLAKDLSHTWLDVGELVEVAHSSGYKDEDILNELDWDIVKEFVLNND